MMLFKPRIPVLSTGARQAFSSVLRTILIASGTALLSLCAPVQADSGSMVIVSSTTELLAALQPQSVVRHIRMLPGDYPVDHPLVVPDGTVLEGAGVLQVEDGLPNGFEPGTATTIRVVSGFEGALLTLGDGSALRGLRLEDLQTAPDGSAQRSGNVIMVGSRGADDVVSTTIRECEIINPNPFGVAADGPTGHGLVVLTRNPARQDALPPHEGAAIAVRLERSIVRASGGGGAVFVINFAAHGKVTATLDGNLIEGPLVVTGGASRPDLVTGASVDLESKDNLYTLSPGGYEAIAWRVFGGSSSHIPGLSATGASFNSLHFRSINDRIEGFKTAIQAAAGRRWQSASGPVSDNRLDLELQGIVIHTDGEKASDLALQGALSDHESDGSREFPPGNRNILHVLIRHATGSSAPRANYYADVFGPELEANSGSGNRIEFAGSPAEFRQSNAGIEPAPPGEYFQDDHPPPRTDKALDTRSSKP